MGANGHLRSGQFGPQWAWLEELKQKITKHCYILNLLALRHGFREEDLIFEATRFYINTEPLGVASLKVL